MKRYLHDNMFAVSNQRSFEHGFFCKLTGELLSQCRLCQFIVGSDRFRMSELDITVAPIGRPTHQSFCVP